MSTNPILIYKGRYPKVMVEGVTFVRNKETKVPDSLFKRLQEGESKLPPGTPHDFVLPASLSPHSQKPAEPTPSPKPLKTG